MMQRPASEGRSPDTDHFFVAPAGTSVEVHTRRIVGSVVSGAFQDAVITMSRGSPAVLVTVPSVVRGAWPWHPVAMADQRGSGPDSVTPGAGEREHTFTAELWRWDARRSDTWTFVTVPVGITAAIEDEADARGPRAGFGSVKVVARVGATTWRTSVFPDAASGCFVLPIKRAVREAQGVQAGDPITVSLRVA